jgi:hypothetical protein
MSLHFFSERLPCEGILTTSKRNWRDDPTVRALIPWESQDSRSATTAGTDLEMWNEACIDMIIFFPVRRVASRQRLQLLRSNAVSSLALKVKGQRFLLSQKSRIFRCNPATPRRQGCNPSMLPPRMLRLSTARGYSTAHGRTCVETPRGPFLRAQRRRY